MRRLRPLVAAVALLAAAAACARRPPLLDPSSKRWRGTAPDSFHVAFETTRGRVVVLARREWSPLAVDRFYQLVRAGYFDGDRFFRVVGGFVAQFGLSGDPRVTAAWKDRALPDEPVRASNRRGTLAFARSGPNTRAGQLYFNLVDNARLDTLNGIGFPPIAETVEGLEVLDSLYAGYGGTRTNRVPGPSQDSITVQGEAYLARVYPKLDVIRTARVVRAPRR